MDISMKTTPRGTAEEAILDALMRTDRRIACGVWTDAGLTMAGSALTGWQTFTGLNEWAPLGLATAIAVDVALCVVLTGDRQLIALQLDSGWKGRVMRVMTALMSGTLNCGMAIIDHHPFLILLHAFLPILLIGLTEYRQAVSLAIANAIADERQRQKAEEKTQQPPVEAIVQPLHLVNQVFTPQPPGRTSPIRNRAVRWLAEQHRHGVDLHTITYHKLASEINAKPDTCRKGLPQWISDVIEGVAV
jgi:hypothetical protein